MKANCSPEAATFSQSSFTPPGRCHLETSMPVGEVAVKASAGAGARTPSAMGRAAARATIAPARPRRAPERGRDLGKVTVRRFMTRNYTALTPL